MTLRPKAREEGTQFPLPRFQEAPATGEEKIESLSVEETTHSVQPGQLKT